ncbi:unnamed protein product [Timema podura]|uniref:Borealin C-terminal domain-containing protein n=1 Tax=Timema podura TaxID=61482 RepID=A0ABN7PFM8_TIMPD|nr:unnamed protein product [Timema podura]
MNAIPTHNGLSVVTPKVQANASSTLLRYPRQGEMAISMSGSPLLVTSIINDRTANVSVPLLDGRVISILPQPNLQPYEVPEMSEETEGHLETLKMNINTLLNAYKSSKNN